MTGPPFSITSSGAKLTGKHNWVQYYLQNRWTPAGSVLAQAIKLSLPRRGQCFTADRESSLILSHLHKALPLPRSYSKPAPTSLAKWPAKHEGSRIRRQIQPIYRKGPLALPEAVAPSLVFLLDPKAELHFILVCSEEVGQNTTGHSVHL